jgi:DNA repair exonuclease SbcCD nuclease subunit
MLVFVSDLHLAPGAWASLPGVRGDSYRAWAQVVSYCFERRKECGGLILGGDIFDSQHPPSEAVEVFLHGLQALQKASVPVLAIQGQHDRADPPWFTVSGQVTHLHGKVAKFDGVSGPCRTAYGLDNLPPAELNEELAKIPPNAEILVLHQMAKGAVPDIAGRQLWDFDPELVPKHVKLVLMGDYHLPWAGQSPASETTLVYGGSTQMQSLDELPDKSFVCVNERDLSVQRVPLKTRPFREYKIADVSELAEAVKKVELLEPDTLVLVRYAATLAGVRDELLKANGTVFYAFRVFSLPILDAGAAPLELERMTDISLSGCLSSAVPPGKEPELFDFVKGLLDTKEPAPYLEGVRVKLERS